MRNGFSRAFGFVLIITAVVGLLFSLLGIIGLWVYKEQVTDSLVGTVQLIDSTLETTGQGLVVAEESLIKAASDVNALQTTIESTGRAISDTDPMIESFSNLFETELPDAVLEAQAALINAQASARTIESTLRIVTSIPFVPGEYDPEIPLDQSLSQVAESLDPLIQSFDDLKSSLDTSQGNVKLISAEINIIARRVDGINQNLSDARAVSQDYQKTITDLQVRVTTLELRLPIWITALTWLLTFLLLWSGIMQIGMLMYGLDLTRRANPVVIEERVVE
jgi:methyl-accepting chemotaxis protein